VASSYTVSTFLTRLEELFPATSGPNITGASLSTAHLIKALLEERQVETLEVFVPPSEFQRRDDMAQIARLILPEHRLGQGTLRFYPAHTAAEIWSDGVDRILLSTDTCHLAHDQYLRDRFSKGPMGIHCLTHGMGQPETFESFQQVTSSRADAITCLSTACLGAIKRCLQHFSNGADLELTVLRNSVDLRRFSPTDWRSKARHRALLGLPADHTLALYLGRITPASKCDLLPLIRQFAVHSSAMDTLVIAGVENYPGYIARCQEAAVRLGLGKRAIFRGAIDHDLTALYYEAADLFVFPCDNIQEAFANTVAEAMACGLPVVGSQWDGLVDLVKDGETGILVPTYLMPGLEMIGEMYQATPLMDNYLLIAQNTIVDERAFGSALGKLLGDAELRSRMGAAGRARIVELCGWPAIKPQIFQLWDRLLAAARASGKRQGNPRLEVPVGELFSEYGTKIEPERWSIKLSELGELVVNGRATLQFYEPTLSLVRSPVIDALFQCLRSGKSIVMREACEQAAEAGKTTADTVYFHIGLLAKRGVIELERASPML
jgi:glycosyltransferase involved in cell wall biosynthesis